MRPAVVRSCVFACALFSVHAPSLAASAGTAMVMNGYQISTDQTDANLNTGNFTMPGTVTVTRPGSDARGDRAKGNTKLGTATLIGNVVVHDSGGAPEARAAGSEYSRNGPSTITCDQLTIDSKTKMYDAQGNVHFTQGSRTATAERGVLNETAHTLHLEGNVVLTDGGSTMKADVVDYNLLTKDVIASGTPGQPMVIQQPIDAAPAPAAPGPPKAKSKK
jgi:lipopolysaccharide export system protein LptA